MDGAQHVDARPADQPEIEDDAIWLGLEDAGDGVRGRFRFPDDANAGDLAEQLDEATADRGRILGWVGFALPRCARAPHSAVG